MAQVAQTRETRSWIEHTLDYLSREWRSIPALAAEWASWDDHDRFVFAVDWPVVEDRLNHLRGVAADGLLTSEQLTCYQELLTLIEQYRPTLEQLLSD